MGVVLWLTVGLALLGAVAVRLAPRADGAVAGAAAALAALPAAALLVAAAGGSTARSTTAWLPGDGLEVGLRLDGLSAAMSATVAVVGLAVVVYGAGYFAGDPRRPSALAGLLAFLAAMQGLVLADGYLALLIFWELVGVASARLIAYARDDPAAAPAAVRAFLTTRSADMGLYLAVLALFAASGSLAFGGERPDGALGALVGMGLVVAAIGKSAQAPLQSWLSAAMAGPTPVSALLHSATMVAAGVYLLARSADLVAGWPLAVAGWVGAVTALLGAAIALSQRDLKLVLAGSTTSQLGLMFVGLAAGGPAVAIFHLVAHAAGKAGLFLTAGILARARETTDLEGLRGAGRDDRRAFAAFAVCALSIAAVPALAGFWSKDHIAAAAEQRPAWFVLVLLAGAGAAAYLLRPALILWDARGARGVLPARPGRAPMLAGAGAMVAGSLLVGAAGGPLAALLGAPPLPASALSLVLSLAAIGAGGAAVLAAVAVPAPVAAALRRQLHVDELLRAVVQRPLHGAARALDRVERDGLDAAVDGIGRAGLALARSQAWVERRVVDAAVDGVAHGVGRGGASLRRVQSGRLHEYLRDAVLGAAALGFILALTALL